MKVVVSFNCIKVKLARSLKILLPIAHVVSIPDCDYHVEVLERELMDADFWLVLNLNCQSGLKGLKRRTFRRLRTT
jgi:hypothetical protein